LPHEDIMANDDKAPDPARRSLLKAAPLGALAVVAARAGARSRPRRRARA
jgi:hypothetical protein